VGGNYAENGTSNYVLRSDYADSARQYIRAAILLQDELYQLFEYVEPDGKNFPTFSLKIQSLLMRISVEIEANFKAILRENKYRLPSTPNINTYHKLEGSHFLSQYEVRLLDFAPHAHTFRPFGSWADGPSLFWYSAYNKSKHDRIANFNVANFESVVTAASGLMAVIASQFYTYEFSDADNRVTWTNGTRSGFEPIAGGKFAVKFPSAVPVAHRYDFSHADIQAADFACANYPYK
jgi:hypothetical protein